jgi:hypothetical protein
MSVAESFLNAGKQFLLATENLKRLDERVSRLADDVAGMNMRLVRVETILALKRRSGTPSRRRRERTLPGETA